MVLGLEASTSVFNKRDEISQRTEQLPNQLTQFLGTASVDRHWQRLAIQFPMMVSQLAKYTRTVPGKNKVVANFVLPPKAAHNLLLASEFSVASLASTPTAVASSPPSDQDPMTHVTTLQFDQQSLEFALRDLQSLVNDELRISNFEIKIAGKDLQLDGITRNQQIKGFSAKNTSVAQILTQIVMLANPDRQTSAADSNQKLLWVLNPLQPDRGTSVLVTTRKAADENGYKLPEPFRPTGT